MAFPTDDLTVVRLDAGTDDPSQARLEILAAVNKLKAVLAAYGAISGICPLDAAGQVPSGHLGNATVADGTTIVKGKVRLATSAEASAGTSEAIAATPLGVKTYADAKVATEASTRATGDSSTLSSANSYAVSQASSYAGAAQSNAIAACVGKDNGHNNVGSYCFAYQITINPLIASGGTIAGACLKAANTYAGGGIYQGAALSGTWRSLGYGLPTCFNGGAEVCASLWQRIA